MENGTDPLLREGRVVMVRTMQAIRGGVLTPSDKAGHYIIPSDDGNFNQALFWIPTRGCTYALSGSGGCTMCDYGGSTRPRSDEELVEEFISQLEHRDIKGISVVNFGGQGSFFDDKEFSPKLRERLLEEIAKRKWIKAFVTESRPEYATREKFRQFREMLGRRFLEIGLGLESVDPLVAEGIINKAFNHKAYKNMLDHSREFEIWLSAHVLLKPNVLTEGEAIDDAVNTIKYILRDVDETHPILRVILMAMNVKPRTLVGWAYKKGIYKPPMLWSCVEIIRRLTGEEREYVKILGFDTGVKPMAYASNGDYTDKELIPAIKQFGRDHDAEPLFKVAKKLENSPSKREWDRRMKKPEKDLRTRLADFYRMLSKEFPAAFEGVNLPYLGINNKTPDAQNAQHIQYEANSEAGGKESSGEYKNLVQIRNA